MKICIVLRDITERGGGERVCANLANALSQKHQIRIISFYQKFSSPSYEINQNIKLHYLSRGGENKWGVVGKIFRKIFYRYFLTYKAGKIFANDEIILANDRALASILKQKNKKYIRLWHLNFPKRHKNLSFFDALVVLSNKELLKWQKIHHNVVVIPNFLPFIPADTTNWEQKSILSVGRMDKGDQKGFLRLIDIFAIIAFKYPQWKLCIVGEGILKQEILKKINQYSLQQQVVIKPFTQEIINEYLQASFYVMSSYFEGFPLVLLESGSLGLPSVAFDIYSGPSDIIQNEKTGFLIEDGNLREFANKMEILIQDQSRREGMGKAAKQNMKNLFSQEVVIMNWENLFYSLQTHTPQSPR